MFIFVIFQAKYVHM